MAKQRKNHSAGIHFGPVVKVVLLCFLFCGTAVGYVWQKNEILRLGRQISDREKKLAQTKDQNEVLRDQFYLLGSQRMIEERVQHSDLGLGPVQPWQVVRLPEPPSRPDSPTRELAGRAATELAP
jgi:cell division protein FtsB